MSKAPVHPYALAVLCVCVVSSAPVHGLNVTSPNATGGEPSVISNTGHGVADATEHTPDTGSNATNVTTTHLSSTGSSITTEQALTTEDSNSTTTSSLPTTSAPGGATTSSKGVVTSGSKDGSAVAILILVIILVLSVVLAVLSYMLWKKGRRYSFDLMNADHDTPLRSMEHGGFFEQTKVTELPTNLEDIKEEESGEAKPVANGCAPDDAEQTPSSPVQNFPEENSFLSGSSLSLDVKKVGFNLDLDLMGYSVPANEASPQQKEQEQNENDDDDSNADDDPVDLFTEINLDEPQ